MGVDAGSFWSQMRCPALTSRDVNEGIAKSCIFGVACSLIAVYGGYYRNTHRGGRRARDDARRGHIGRRRAVLGLSAHRRVFVKKGIPCHASRPL